MVKSIVSKLSSASTLSIASSISSVSSSVVSSSAVQETNYAKHRNDPGRFFGDGVQFKAKLIGILEVGEARGDRMCQEALQDLKMAIRAAGEHKQRITIHVTIEGLRLRDEKTGDSLYHHPVHKISFIAQDMTDSRAFGYIFGSPDSGHRFFGIKTDKAASQVVLAMRDLFQVVFELKKKEIELARQQIQSKTIHEHQQQLSSMSGVGGGSSLLMKNNLSGSGHSDGIGGTSTGTVGISMLGGISSSSGGSSKLTVVSGGNSADSAGKAASLSNIKEMSPESVADLVDLEQELSSLQRGITQMERITPSEPTPAAINSKGGSSGGGNTEEDPFGDSFTKFPTYNILPPPESTRSRSKPNKPPDLSANNLSVSVLNNIPSGSAAGTVTTSSSPSNLQQISMLLANAKNITTHNTNSPSSSLSSNNHNHRHHYHQQQHHQHQQQPHQPQQHQLQRDNDNNDDKWLAELDQNDDIFNTSRAGGMIGLGLGPLGVGSLASAAPLAPREPISTPTGGSVAVNNSSTSTLDVTPAASFTDDYHNAAAPQSKQQQQLKSDLDPLGTGRIRPYVDKKYFFQELKNPPKKVLKDLSSSSASTSGGSSAAGARVDSTLLASQHSGASADDLAAAAAGADSIFGEMSPLQPDMSSIDSTSLTRVGFEQQASYAAVAAVEQQFNQLPIATMLAMTSATGGGGGTTAMAAGNCSTTTTSSSSVNGTAVSSLLHSKINLQLNIPPSNIHSNNSNNSDTTGGGTGGADTATAVPQTGGTSANDPVMLPRDTDPFSPTRKKSDPFHEGDIFSKLDPFEFEFPSASPSTVAATSTMSSNRTHAANSTAMTDDLLKSSSTTVIAGIAKKADVFNGPLQVTLPPESAWSSSLASSKPSITSGGGGGGGAFVSSPIGMDNRQQQRKLERQTSESPTLSSAVTAAGGASVSINRNRPSSSVFKQNTVDVISSISSKKMPHLFGQKFSKRDSNSINMRRLQESDSLSENEAAPEPPPRPDLASHHSLEPPPLPPKKQFSDIIIRPRGASQSSLAGGNRYEFVSKVAVPLATATRNSDVPPIPLPSRRVGRSDGTYPGPGRPRKPGAVMHVIDMDGDYLTPISCVSSSGSADVPPLLPPPSQSSRGRTSRQRHEIYENKTEIEQQQQQRQQQLEHDICSSTASSILPDITLSQLLTLGIDELAAKLSVPTSKLSTMTLVELTTYLSEFIEKSAAKPQPPRPQPRSEPPPLETMKKANSESSSAPIFKVNFDQMTGTGGTGHGSDATFIAKFDDNFGEESTTFIANFSHFNKNQTQQKIPSPKVTIAAAAIPPADRYAVFREIIDQELQQENIIELNSSPEDDAVVGVAAETEQIDEDEGITTSNVHEIIAAMTLSGSQYDNDEENERVDEDSDNVNQQQTSLMFVPPKIDTKITEAISHAKDRYAALRDIILVEDLFDKKPPILTSTPPRPPSECLMQDFPEFSDEFNSNADEDLHMMLDDDKSRRSEGVSKTAGRADSSADSRAAATSSALTVEDESSPESNQNEEYDEDYQQLPSQQQDQPQHSVSVANKQQDTTKFLHTITASKDDLEIDELMNRAISNLSLDSREHLSPNNAASSIIGGCSNVSPRASPLSTIGTTVAKSSSSSLQFNDVSTSPIPLQQKTSARMQHQQQKPQKTSPLSKSPLQQRSPISVQLAAVSNLIDSATKHLNSTSDLAIVGGVTSSPDADLNESKLTPNKESSWAIFDSKPMVAVPVTQPTEKYRREHHRQSQQHHQHHHHHHSQNLNQQRLKSPKVAALTLPTALTPPSNISSRGDDDAAESPCSSDEKEGWKEREHDFGSSKHWPKSVGGGENIGGGGGGQQTSSSSRDLSPWDDENSDYKKKIPPPGTDRHGYYMRHARRMNSCDDNYEYEEEFSKRRDHRKIKTGISRSRDNFDFDQSPNWYNTGGHHYTWSPQEEETGRGRSFDRSAYERTTYGPPVYDKRDHKMSLPPPPPPSHSTSSTYDRRSGSGVGYDKRKYYREYSRSNYDFDGYGESPPPPPTVEAMGGGGVNERHKMYDGSFEKMKSLGSAAAQGGRRNYENVYDDDGGPRSLYKSSRGDYMYERDRKSFDRESVESYESASRRRRSFGSGDVYGSLESREEFRDRYMGGGGVSGTEKTRSLRKSIKMRATGDIDYEQDSENDFQQHSRRGGGATQDTRSLQRSTHGPGGSVGVPQRMRKSSGSSPWDGDEPPHSIGSSSGQKGWKRPGSASESERRLAESRRVAALAHTPSGSDGEKDRRFRKKQRSRGKDLPVSSAAGGLRYSGSSSVVVHPRDNYDYITYDDDDVDDEDYDDAPMDEDKFERLNRRRHEMHQRMMESSERDRRQHSSQSTKAMPSSSLLKSSSKMPATKQQQHSSRSDFDFDDFEDAPRSNASSSGGNGGGSGGGKFNFEDHGGFESDFNQSPPPPPAHRGSCNSIAGGATPSSVSAPAAPATKALYRFSNDFSDKEKLHHQQHQQHQQQQHHYNHHHHQQQQQHSHSHSHTMMMTSSTSTSLAGGNCDSPEMMTAVNVVESSPVSSGGVSQPSLPPPPPPPTQKIRFDDKVTISKFDNDQPSSAFEDDFSKAEFDFEKEDHWNSEPLSVVNNNNIVTTTTTTTMMTTPALTTTITATKKNNLRCLNSKLQQRQDLIKKSESINIFAKKTEDPFEDDEFFKSPPSSAGGIGIGGGGGASELQEDFAIGDFNGKQQSDADAVSFQWDNNFAKFDENM